MQLQQHLIDMLLSYLTNPLFFVFIFLIIIYLVIRNIEYRKGSYYKVTKLPYLLVRFNTGRYGEYLTYKRFWYGVKFEKALPMLVNEVNK